MQYLHLDVETYSSENLKTSGAYRYSESMDFEVLLLAYAFNDEPVQILELCEGDSLPRKVYLSLTDDSYLKCAHNAVFERLAFKNGLGIEIPIEQWFCTQIKAGFCGYPLSLEQVSKAMELEEKGKLTTGKSLIRYFCMPCKPTKANGGRLRNLPQDDPEKWEQFKEYCIGDVEAEREIHLRLKRHIIPAIERRAYALDQEINDNGIGVDVLMAENACRLDAVNSSVILDEIKSITGLENPNSLPQLKKWLTDKLGYEVTTLNKETVPHLIEKADGQVRKVLELRSKISKTSIKKYTAMINCVCDSGRAHGLIQFYGASRTGRWAGRLIQVQNLTKNHADDLETLRATFKTGDYDLVSMISDDISSDLSQLVRTTFIAPVGRTFAVADFSAIEARVIAWLAGEAWRLEVFSSHGKIYEASASMMFGVPMEEVTKGSDLRSKGKVAELALGYQGSVGALKQMGAEKMGLEESEMKNIVSKWRDKSPNIVRLWKLVEGYAMKCIRYRKEVTASQFRGLTFRYEKNVMTIELPSGRKLYYQDAQIFSKTTETRLGMWTRDAIRYKGIKQENKQWGWIDTYGGKLVENIVQAIARDLLSEAMLRLHDNDYKIVMHVHDEAIVEVSDHGGDQQSLDDELDSVEYIMAEQPVWAEGLPLAADGYITPFYKKD